MVLEEGTESFAVQFQSSAVLLAFPTPEEKFPQVPARFSTDESRTKEREGGITGVEGWVICGTVIVSVREVDAPVLL